MTCPARLWYESVLICTRPAGHPDGHVYVASDAPDRHTPEPRDEDR